MREGTALLLVAMFHLFHNPSKEEDFSMSSKELTMTSASGSETNATDPKDVPAAPPKEIPEQLQQRTCSRSNLMSRAIPSVRSLEL